MSSTATASPAASEELRKWAYAWRMMLRALFPVSKSLARDAFYTAAHGSTLNLGDVFGKAAKYASPARFFKPNTMAALDALSRTKLSLSLMKSGKRLALVIHKSSNPFAGKVDLMPDVYGEGPFTGVRIEPTWRPVRAPYLSKVLEDGTGFDAVFFEPAALDGRELSNVIKAAREGWKDTDVRSWMEKKIAEAKSAPAGRLIRPHLPVSLPQFSSIKHAFRGWGKYKALGPGFPRRAAGWAAIGASAAAVMSIVSFSSFVRGKNPGFVAQALFRSAPVGWAVGALVNMLHAKKLRKKMRELQRRATLTHEHQVQEAQRALLEARARKWTDMARTLQAGRYGALSGGRR